MALKLEQKESRVNSDEELSSGLALEWKSKRALKQSSNNSSPISSPKSSKSSGYHSSQSSTDESNEETDANESFFEPDLNGWDRPDPFDPNDPYRNEPLIYPSKHVLVIPQQFPKRLYAPFRSLPKRLPLKRASRSPEIKGKLSKLTGLPKRSSQFLGLDSPSEDSDAD